jgi:hypothetical protein
METPPAPPPSPAFIQQGGILLNLPPAMRNQIYAFVALLDNSLALNGAKLERSDHGSVFDAAMAARPLPQTCRQIKQEYLAAAVSTGVGSITLIVPDIGLQQLETFHENLGADELKALQSSMTHFRVIHDFDGGPQQSLNDTNDTKWDGLTSYDVLVNPGAAFDVQEFTSFIVWPMRVGTLATRRVRRNQLDPYRQQSQSTYSLLLNYLKRYDPEDDLTETSLVNHLIWAFAAAQQRLENVSPRYNFG